jgi:hypothetical protein
MLVVGRGNRRDALFILKHIRFFERFPLVESVFCIEEIGFHDVGSLCIDITSMSTG